MIKYVVESMWPPFIFTAPISNIVYIMPGWIKTDGNVTLDEIKWVKPDWLIEFEKNKPQPVKTFKSSKGDTTYTVMKRGDEYSCDCPGYKFRNKNCKHIKQVS